MKVKIYNNNDIYEISQNVNTVIEIYERADSSLFLFQLLILLIF